MYFCDVYYFTSISLNLETLLYTSLANTPFDFKSNFYCYIKHLISLKNTWNWPMEPVPGTNTVIPVQTDSSINPPQVKTSYFNQPLCWVFRENHYILFRIVLYSKYYVSRHIRQIVSKYVQTCCSCQYLSATSMFVSYVIMMTHIGRTKLFGS